MALKEYYGLVGRLIATIDASTVSIPVDPEFSGAIVFSGFGIGDESYLSLSAGGISEVVKLVGVEGSYLIVERAQSGTAASAFPIGAVIRYEVTTQGILAALGDISTQVSLTATGIAGVQALGPNNFNINVPAPAFSGEGGVEVFGTYPNVRIAYVQPEGNCCGGQSGNTGLGISELIGEGLVTAFVNGSVGTVRVRPLELIAGPNIQITGTWPQITITATAGSGTVASVAVGAGLNLTGLASVNPTISMQNTGVVAGTYGGIAINARGQITAVPASFNPISIITAGTNVEVDRTGDNVTVDVPNAAVGVRGAVALADETDPFDPGDNVNAATPAVIAAAMASIAGATLTGASSYSAETPALYSNVIGATAQALVLVAGENALVVAEATMVDTLAPTTPPDFGLAVFDTLGIVRGNKLIHQSQQSMSFMLTGPLNTALTLATTAIPAGSSVTAYSLSILKL